MPLPAFSDDQYEQMLRGLRPGAMLPKTLLTRFAPSSASTQAQKLPTYDEWMKTTKLGMMKPRSSRLGRIDKALKTTQSTPTVKNANELRAAITDWIRWKGDGWITSERNKDHIVEKLRIQAFAPNLPIAVTKQEETAWAEVLKGSQRSLQTYFVGKKVTLRFSSALKGAKDAATGAKSAYSTFKKVADGAKSGFPKEARPDPAAAAKATAKFVTEDLLDLQPGDLVKLGSILPVQDLITDLMPVVNVVIGGVKVVVKWGQVAKAAHLQCKSEDRAYVMAKGDPSHAFHGLIEMLSRDTKSKAIKAGTETAKFGGQLAGTFADGATATGAVMAALKAAADLAHMLFLLGRELKESRAANKLLDNPGNLDFRLFEAYPLLGCYLIRYATLSDIIALNTVQFGSRGWMDDIEQMKKRHIDPLRKECERFIKASLFHIEGMPMTKA